MTRTRGGAACHYRYRCKREDEPCGHIIPGLRVELVGKWRGGRSAAAKKELPARDGGPRQIESRNKQGVSHETS